MTLTPLPNAHPFCKGKPGRILGSATAGLPAVMVLIAAFAVWPGDDPQLTKARWLEIAATPLLGCLPWLIFRAVKKHDSCFLFLALLACSWWLACLHSIAPLSSLIGGPVRGQGLIYWLTCAVVFTAIAVSCRSGAILGIFWAICVTVAGVAAFAIFQRLSGAGSIDATLGNPSFVRDWIVIGVVTAVSVAIPKLPRALWLVPAAVFLVWTVGARWQSVEYRLSAWNAVIHALPGVPIWGYGPETGIVSVDVIVHPAVKDTDRRQDRTENLELDAWIERGPFGALTEVLFWGAVLIKGWRSPYATPLMSCLGLAQISVMPVSGQLLAYVLAGLAVGGTRIDSADTQPPDHAAPDQSPSASPCTYGRLALRN